MLDQVFCSLLEHELSKYFANSASAPVKNFWCDGVLLPMVENHCSQKYVNDNRKVVMSAYAGLSGQDLYELILYFGKKSLSRYARGLIFPNACRLLKATIGSKWMLKDEPFR